MSISSKLSMFARCFILLYLNYLFEFGSRVSFWLYEECPQIILILSKFGVSWLSCYICLLVSLIIVLLIEFDKKINWWLDFVLLIVFASLYSLILLMLKTTVPMCSGIFPFYPSKIWDYVVISIFFITLILVITMKYIIKSPAKNVFYVNLFKK
jgi:hypothetical protein